MECCLQPSQLSLQSTSVCGIVGKSILAWGLADLDSYTGHKDSTQDKVSQLFVIEAGGRHRNNDKKL